MDCNASVIMVFTDTQNIDIKQVGFISTIPHVCAIVSYPLCGIIADYLRKNKILTPTQVSTAPISPFMSTRYRIL